MADIDPEIERLVAEIIPQARSEAWRAFQNAPPHTVELDELISLAYQGLAQAAARWADYCQRNQYSPLEYRYFGAYATRRIRGAMLDAMRSSDWVTRSVRSRAKSMRLAEQAASATLTEAEMAERTGLSVGQVRETLAGLARKPVSMDAEVVDIAGEDDVEGKAVVNSVLAQALAAVRELPATTQLILAAHYFAGKDFREITTLLDLKGPEVRTLHDEGVLAVHAVMLRAVQP